MLITTLSTNEWMTSHAFLYVVLVIGAMLTAGVGVSVFSFYVDDYWTDEKFRENLRKGRKA